MSTILFSEQKNVVANFLLYSIKNCTKLNYLRTENELLYEDDVVTKSKDHDYPEIFGSFGWDIFVSNRKSQFEGKQESAEILVESSPNDIKQFDTFSSFKRRIKAWKGVECSSRLCGPFVAPVGFLSGYVLYSKYQKGNIVNTGNTVKTWHSSAYVHS